MNARRLWNALVDQPLLNFLLTNGYPRRTVTRLVGWLSRIEHPLVARTCIGIWKACSALDLSDARVAEFRSMHACFTRQLRDGARPIDPDPLAMTSPCDGIVGGHGEVTDGTLVQAKGSRYSLEELLGSAADAAYFSGGCYVTLRLRSSMYHRFHAPIDCRIHRVAYFPGDTWNVNPATLARVPRLFCRNERAALFATLQQLPAQIVMVPVAAVLVASLRLHFLDMTLHLRYRGPHRIACDAPHAKGEEMGWFEQGSTIIVLAPRGFKLANDLHDGLEIRMGRPLMHVPAGTP